MCQEDRKKEPCKLKKGICDFVCKLLSDFIRLLVIGLVLLAISPTPTGNWFKCNFLDTDGCLPYFQIASIKMQSINLSDMVKYSDNNWRETDSDNIPNSIFKLYTLEVRNNSYNGSGDYFLKWEPIYADINKETKLIKYRLHGKRGSIFKCSEKSKCTEFRINAIDFTSTDWLNREITYVDLIIQIPKTLYLEDNPNIQFALRCDQCQVPFQISNK